MTLTSYFPETELTDLPPGSILRSEFEKHLGALKEPVLCGRPGVHYAIRLLLMTSFYGDALLRIEDVGTRITADYERRPTAAAPDTKANLSLHSEIPREAFEKLVAKVQDSDFFLLSDKQDVVATDGTIWLLEVCDKTRYHVTYRAGPFSSAVHDIGKTAVSLIGVDVTALE